MKKSYLIAGFVTAAIITAGSVGYAAATKDTCNYDPASGNYHSDGKVYAYGSWDDAVACAKEGILPKQVRMLSGGPYCQNCGRTSHCGTPLLEDFRNWKDEHMGAIEVCKHCRCEKCSKLSHPGDSGC